MITAHPKVRIQYLRDSQAVYTANGAEGLRYATSCLLYTSDAADE